jgi:cell division protein FtsB
LSKVLPAGLARRLPAALFLAVAVYYAVWGGEYSAFDLLRLHNQRVAAAAGLEDTAAQVDSLGALAKRLDGDRATIEAVARERFGMIRDGELLYRFVPVDPEAAANELRVTARTP